MMGPRYAPLFQPLKIGPVTAPNRFVAVPYALGFSDLMPNGAMGFRETRAEGGWGIVNIEDNGTGITEENLPRIFESFFTTKPIGHGTGLGLDISYNIVARKHKGDIRVKSKPGCTQFEVWLPIEMKED